MNKFILGVFFLSQVQASLGGFDVGGSLLGRCLGRMLIFCGIIAQPVIIHPSQEFLNAVTDFPMVQEEKEYTEFLRETEVIHGDDDFIVKETPWGDIKLIAEGQNVKSKALTAMRKVQRRRDMALKRLNTTKQEKKKKKKEAQSKKELFCDICDQSFSFDRGLQSHNKTKSHKIRKRWQK
jgi:hypothetical protein